MLLESLNECRTSAAPGKPYNRAPIPVEGNGQKQYWGKYTKLTKRYHTQILPRDAACISYTAKDMECIFDTACIFDTTKDTACIFDTARDDTASFLGSYRLPTHRRAAHMKFLPSSLLI